MAEIRKVLVLGAKGTLGGQLMRLYPEATGWDREEVDVLDAAALGARLDGLGSVPLAVVNCVASKCSTSSATFRTRPASRPVSKKNAAS